MFLFTCIYLRHVPHHVEKPHCDDPTPCAREEIGKFSNLLRTDTSSPYANSIIKAQYMLKKKNLPTKSSLIFPDMWNKNKCLESTFKHFINYIALKSVKVRQSRAGKVLHFNRCCSCCSVAKLCPTLRPRWLQPARLPCLLLSPRLYSNSCSLSWWFNKSEFYWLSVNHRTSESKYHILNHINISFPSRKSLLIFSTTHCSDEYYLD